jgi:hypothetical protein
MAAPSERSWRRTWLRLRPFSRLVGAADGADNACDISIRRDAYCELVESRIDDSGICLRNFAHLRRDALRTD